jgi:hypothetical protein
MKSVISFCIVLFALCFLQVSMAQTIIHVPADYPTIQEGIDAANPGDTVLVADGLYYEQISFLGKKPLMVASNYLLDSDTNHINNTIIDGSQLTDMDNASVVYFSSGEDTTSVLCGFTIQGGKGTFAGQRFGGGIYISGSGARIIHNNITGNSLDDTQPVNGQDVIGAGIGTRDDNWLTWIVIEHNKIYGNTAVSDGWAQGGGINVAYNARIAYNDIYENSVTNASVNGWALGGGISHVSINSQNKTMIVHQNKIHHNLAQAVQGVGTDAAVDIQFSKLIFTNNEVYANQAICSGNMGGVGALAIVDPLEGDIVSGNTFRDNISSNLGGAIHLENYNGHPNPPVVIISDNYFINNEATKSGGAISTFDIPISLQNNVFSGNHTNDRGGAIILNKSGSYPFKHLATMINNSFYGNSTVNYGGAIHSIKAQPLIFNSIFFNNSANGGGSDIYVNNPTDTLDIANCDIDFSMVYGNIFDGGGNITTDPEFEDLELLTLQVTSPCIGAGTITYTCNCGNTRFCPLHDLLGVNRPQGAGVEMGAYEMLFTGFRNDKINASGIEISPNPFIDLATISYTLEREERIEISLYSSQGNQVKVLLSGTQSKGSHTLEINAADLPAGVYLLRISTIDNRQATMTKVVKL